jgi:hypothetical protein
MHNFLDIGGYMPYDHKRCKHTVRRKRVANLKNSELG